MTRVRWTAADGGLPALLVVLLMAVAVLAHCADRAGDPTVGVVPVAAVGLGVDEAPPPSCPDSHPRPDGIATAAARGAAVDLAPTGVAADRASACVPTGDPAGPASAHRPDPPAGADLCTENCVSRR